MNDFTANKIGEVCAFANVWQETLTRAETALRPVYGETFDEIRNSFSDLHDALLAFAERENVADTVKAKCAGTSEKLRAMQNTYLTDEEDWQDAIELLEWSSFFYGAGFAHSELIIGTAETLDKGELLELGQSSSKLHHDLLHDAAQRLREDGKNRAGE